MPRIDLQHLLKPTTTPEQEILLNWFYSQFDFRNVGANRHIVNVEPLFYEGDIAGTEFLVYAATKLYISYELQFISNAVGNPSINFPYVALYNENNAVLYNVHKNISFYETAPAASTIFLATIITLKNKYFSRITNLIYNGICFNGYRITLN